MKTAGLVLENRDVATMAKDAEVWEKIATKMHAGAMPPPGSKRPDGAAYQSFITSLETSLDRVAASIAAPPPPIRPLPSRIPPTVPRAPAPPA